MNRQQFALVVYLGLTSFFLALAAGTTAQAADWKTADEPDAPASGQGGSTLSGKLYRNSADQNGSAPYLLLDKWGVVRGYVAAAAGVDLESNVGQQVNLQGTIRTLPGGDMPCMTCQKIVGGNGEALAASAIATSAEGRGGAANATVPTSSFEPNVARAPQAAKPATQAQSLPLREVVLEPQPASGYAPGRSDRNQASDDRSPARRPAPRRTRYANGRAVAYTETIPTPSPATAPHVMHGAPEPMSDPGPAIEGGRMVAHGPMEMEGPMSEGPMNGPMQDGGDCCGGDSCGDCEGPCPACSDEYDAAWGPHRPLFLIGPTGLWAKADYLLWAESGTQVPALVTSGPNATNPGYVGQPDTVILYGDDKLNTEARSGFRFQAGLWMNRCCTFGFEGEGLFLGDEQSNYHKWSDGNPIVARPFFNVGAATPSENVELVALPRGNVGSVDGSIDINAITRFNGGGARFLFVLCRQDGCWTDDCSCANFHDRYRATLTAGYRYLDLEDQLGIYEKLTTTSGVVQTGPDTSTPGTAAFQITDQFSTRNSFNGGEVGMKFEVQRNRWGLDAFSRIGIGSTHAVATINGTTIITDTGGTQHSFQGGLLAQSTNIGTYSEDLFSVVPEIDVNLSYQITPHAKLVAGYSFLYWSKVLRAGEQIDRSVNENLIPVAQYFGATPTGESRPQFSFAETGFWAQGLNIGLDCRW